MSEELKPCPFCGTPPGFAYGYRLKRECPGHDGDGCDCETEWFAFAYCKTKDCPASGEHDGQCFVGDHKFLIEKTQFADVALQATATWNHRVTQV